MSIRKQEFYEGAALHLLARRGHIEGLTYTPPFFTLNSVVSVLLKYSATARSPWSFTFSPEEQRLLEQQPSQTVIGLICGADGVAALPYEDFLEVAQPRQSAIHLACYRHHGEHYEVNGPDGTMRRKVPPSAWQRILG